MSHRHNILHQNEFGYVSQCEGCTTLQVSLGNFLFSLPQAEYGAFVQMLRTLPKQEETAGRPLPLHLQYRPYQLQTPVDSLFVAISEKEYSQTLELLSMAEVLLHTYTLLK